LIAHNLFLHSALVQSRQVNRSKSNRIAEAMMYFSIEAFVAIGISFLINLAVVCVFAKGFYDPLCAPDGLARFEGVCSDKVGFTNAAYALQSLLGGSAQIVWAIGLLASGQSSTMTGVQTGQFIMSGFLQLKITPWKRVLLTRSIALVPAVTVALASLGEQTRLDKTTQLINVQMSLVLPFAALPLLHFTSSKEVMGEFVNSTLMNAIGWTFSLTGICINFFLVTDQLQGSSFGIWSLFSVAAFFYISTILYLLQEELMWIYGRITGKTSSSSAAMERLQDMDSIETRSSLSVTSS